MIRERLQQAIRDADAFNEGVDAAIEMVARHEIRPHSCARTSRRALTREEKSWNKNLQGLLRQLDRVRIEGRTRSTDTGEDMPF